MKYGSVLARFAGCAVLLLAAATVQAAAPAWQPQKNVEIIIPGGVGGGQDRTARIMQKIMQEGLVPVSVTVINKPGGGGNIAYTYLNQFMGDGHYLATATATLLTNNIL